MDGGVGLTGRMCGARTLLAKPLGAVFQVFSRVGHACTAYGPGPQLAWPSRDRVTHLVYLGDNEVPRTLDGGVD